MCFLFAGSGQGTFTFVFGASVASSQPNLCACGAKSFRMGFGGLNLGCEGRCVSCCGECGGKASVDFGCGGWNLRELLRFEQWKRTYKGASEVPNHTSNYSIICSRISIPSVLISYPVENICLSAFKSFE